MCTKCYECFFFLVWFDSIFFNFRYCCLLCWLLLTKKFRLPTLRLFGGKYIFCIKCLNCVLKFFKGYLYINLYKCDWIKPIPLQQMQIHYHTVKNQFRIHRISNFFNLQSFFFWFIKVKKRKEKLFTNKSNRIWQAATIFNIKKKVHLTLLASTGM